nr:MAG TPA: hypothetical protein [Caudoviricetes sp.]
MKIFLALSGKLGYNVISDNFITFLAPIFASIFVIILLCNKLQLYCIARLREGGLLFLIKLCNLLYLYYNTEIAVCQS